MEKTKFYLDEGLKIEKGHVFTISGHFKRLSFLQWIKEKVFGIQQIREYQRFIVTKDCTSADTFIPYKLISD